MVRWLAPYLPGRPRWVLHDRDPALLARAGAAVEPRMTDLAALTPADLAGADVVVTASALLDVLTADEVDAVAAACAQRRVPALLALTVLGGVGLDPPDPLDDVVAAAFDAHQRRPVAGRRLLGPDARRRRRPRLRGPRRRRRRPAQPLAARPRRHGAAGGVAARLGRRRREQRPGAGVRRLPRRPSGRRARAGGYVSRSITPTCSSAGREPVAQEDDVVDRADLEELGPRVAGGEAPVAGEPGRGRSRRGRTARRPGAARRPARRRGRPSGSRHRPRPAAGGHPEPPDRRAGRKRDRVAGVHDLRPAAEPRPQGGDRRAGRVDQAVGVPGVEEGGRGVEVTGPRDGDLGRGWRAARGPPGPRAARRSGRAGRGSSARTVPAPTRIASHAARTSSTRSRSAAVERTRRWEEVSSRYPSIEVAQLSTTNGRPCSPTAITPGPGPGRGRPHASLVAASDHHGSGRPAVHPSILTGDIMSDAVPQQAPRRVPPAGEVLPAPRCGAR